MIDKLENRRQRIPAHRVPNLPVPLLSIQEENEALMGDLVAAATRVLYSGRYILGSEVESLEAEVGKICQAKYAVGCASGSDALLLALMAIGVGPGDEVIVPSFTFFATASAVSRLGAVPVFADIDPISFNISADQIEPCLSVKTKAIIPVHLFGQSADLDPILEIARTCGARVIEDAAQSIGAHYGGRPVGALGDIGCFSFYPTKNLGGFGDAGMLTTNDAELADTLRLLRGHGMRPRYYHQHIGVNSRLDALQAALLRVKLPHLEELTKRRRENAARYHQLFADAKLLGVTLPLEASHGDHVWNQFTIRIARRRDELRTFLADRQIGSEVYYPIPLHRQQCFASLGYDQGTLPATEQAADEVLSLPIHPGLTEFQQEAVVDAIREFASRK